MKLGEFLKQIIDLDVGSKVDINVKLYSDDETEYEIDSVELVDPNEGHPEFKEDLDYFVRVIIR